MTITMTDGTAGPLRGDLVQTVLRDRRGGRTYLVLRSRQVKRRAAGSPARFHVWAVRWWELEPEMRQALAASAARRPGGQRLVLVEWNRKKKKETFEAHMRRNCEDRS